MKSTRFSNEQKIRILLDAEKEPVADVAQRHGISVATVRALQKELERSRRAQAELNKLVERVKARYLKRLVNALGAPPWKFWVSANSKAAAVASLVEIGPQAIPSLVMALSGRGAAHASDALQGIGEPCVDVLIGQFTGPGDAWAALTLGAIGAPALPRLTQAAQNADPTTRMWAVITLGEMRLEELGDVGAEAIRVLGSALRDSDADVRHAAEKVMAKGAPAGRAPANPPIPLPKANPEAPCEPPQTMRSAPAWDWSSPAPGNNGGQLLEKIRPSLPSVFAAVVGTARDPVFVLADVVGEPRWRGLIYLLFKYDKVYYSPETICGLGPRSEIVSGEPLYKAPEIQGRALKVGIYAVERESLVSELCAIKGIPPPLIKQVQRDGPNDMLTVAYFCGSSLGVRYVSPDGRRDEPPPGDTFF